VDNQLAQIGCARSEGSKFCSYRRSGCASLVIQSRQLTCWKLEAVDRQDPGLNGRTRQQGLRASTSSRHELVANVIEGGRPSSQIESSLLTPRSHATLVVV
jgi:hypothetical protein